MKEKRKQGKILIQADERVSMHGGEALKARLVELAEEPGTLVVLNLAEVRAIDSSGLGILLFGQRRLAQTGGTLILAEASPSIDVILQQTGMPDIMPVYITEAEALEHK